MATNFPGSLDDNTTLPNPGANSPTNNPSHAQEHDNENDAIKAIQAKVGTGASTPTAGKIFRGTGTGTSAWGAADLTTDITGVLPVANGGTGLSVLLIPASAILVGTTDAQDLTNKTLHDTFMGTTFMSQSPTFRNVLLDASVNYLATQLVDIGAAFTLEIPATSSLEIKPFLESQGFASAQHDHKSAAGGGVLTYGSIGTDSSWAWQAFTPTWAGLTVGNATTNSGFYTQIGKTVFFRILFILGSTSAVTGVISFVPPVTARTLVLQRLILGTVLFDHTGLGNNFGYAFMSAVNAIDLYIDNVSGTYGSLSGTNASSPFVWVTGDSFEVEGFYEAA